MSSKTLGISFILIFLAAAGSWLAKESFFPKPQRFACPKGEGNYILPRTYPGKTLFISYSNDIFQTDFVVSAIKSIVDQKLNIDVAVLVPKSEIKEAHKSLRAFQKKPYKQFVKILATPVDESLWVQDYIEHAIDLSSKEDRIVELPYWEREAEIMPKTLSLFKGWELLDGPAMETFTEEHTDADYGGNIEALPYDFVLVGETMANSMKTHLKSLLPHQKLLEVPIQWVENNHVDEVFTLLPARNSQCGFAIGYASPGLAMKLLSQSPLNQSIRGNGYIRDAGDRTYPFDHCSSSKTFFECHELERANLVYEKQIVEAKEIIRAAMSESCPDLQLVPFPQLFMPIYNLKEYGYREDMARALNPSIINNLLIGQHILYSKQSFEAFRKDTVNKLRSLGLTPVALESGNLHSVGGGLHCASLMASACH